MKYPEHLEKTSFVPATDTAVFGFVDDPARFSSHMNKSSLMMAGGKMETTTDEGKGQKVGSHIKMGGKVFGIDLSLDEVVTEYQPPKRKVWETVGTPKLLVIGNYQMGVDIATQNGTSNLKVFIDYELPSGPARLFGYLFGGMYANWCVEQMLGGVVEHFQTK